MAAVDKEQSVGVIYTSGTFLEENNADAITSTHPYSLLLHVVDDIWSPLLGLPATSATTELIQGLLSMQNEAFGWNAVVQKGLQVRPQLSVVLLSPSLLHSHFTSIACAAL